MNDIMAWPTAFYTGTSTKAEWYSRTKYISLLYFLADNSEHQAAQPAQTNLIWFRFKEGYSNAVRKSVKIQDFL